MKFLLTALNAKYIHSNPGIYSMRAFIPEKLRKYVEIAEYTINNRMEEILEDIYKRSPDVIGFSCYIWNWDMIKDVIVELHKIRPELPIWLGGPEVSYDAEVILKENHAVTGIMVGEGEETFRELLEEYVESDRRGRDLADVPDGKLIKGTVCRGRETVQRELLDLSELPFIYDDFDTFANRIIYYESSRGCPFRCSYCLSSIDKSVRFRNIELVKKELKLFLDKKVKQVKFVDRTFNCNHEHTGEIWNYIKENDNGITNFHFEIAADLINEQEVELLRTMRPGLVQLEIGVQSTNPHTLDAIHRFTKLEHLQEIVEKIQKGRNVHIHLDLIAGLPYEDYDSFANSFNQVYGMHPEQLQLGFLKVLKGSEMYRRAEEFGIIYNSKTPYEVLYSKWISYPELRKLKQIEQMVELYYNSNQFTYTIHFLEKFFDNAFLMYEKMAKYYEENQYFIQTPARSYRYQVLFEFIKSQVPEKQEVFRELLILDMYLRENLKKRPDFIALEGYLAEEKAAVSAFYEKEEKELRYLKEYAGYNGKQMMKMTHLEKFRYTVLNPEKPEKEQETYILFSYEKRNPLTYDAELFDVTGEIVHEKANKRNSGKA